MSQFLKFYFTSSMLNMFRTLIHPSSGACDFSIVSPHWSCVLVSVVCWSFGVAGWGGIRVAGWERFEMCECIVRNCSQFVAALSGRLVVNIVIGRMLQ